MSFIPPTPSSGYAIFLVIGELAPKKKIGIYTTINL